MANTLRDQGVMESLERKVASGQGLTTDEVHTYAQLGTLYPMLRAGALGPYGQLGVAIRDQDGTAAAAAIIGSIPGEGLTATSGKVVDAAIDGRVVSTGAADMTTALQLRTQLGFQQAGILDANGQLTRQAILSSDPIKLADGVIKNPSIVSELTKDGSNISEWGKYNTQSVTMPNGQSLQIHYYMNGVTGKIDYVAQDFKVKGVVRP